jgi:hypothetical protein
MNLQTESITRKGNSSRRLLGAISAVFVSALCACSPAGTPVDSSATASFPVVIAVQAARDAPVAGARILSNEKLVGRTDGSGLSRLRLRGRDGQTLALTIECPAGFSSPETPVPVALRELAPGSRPPRFEAHCTATTHSVLVAIRAEHGANLPILQLDQRVGTTDGSGIAHVLLANVTPDQPIALELDTSLQPALRPQNPVLTFVPAARDELVLLDQPFSRVEPKRKPRAARRIGPQRL